MAAAGEGNRWRVVSRRQNWKPRRARLLQKQDAAALIDSSPVARSLHQTLTGQGYRLNPTIRPYLHGDGKTVTLRFVWRLRAAGESVTVRFNSRARVVVERESEIANQEKEMV